MVGKPALSAQVERELRAEEEIARIRAIGERVNAMRLAAPADDPLQGAAFKTVALCGRVEAMIRANLSKPVNDKS